MIDWNSTYAAIWRQRQAYLRPVKQIDPVCLEQLLGIEAQKQRLIDNTERFLSAQPANTEKRCAKKYDFFRLVIFATIKNTRGVAAVESRS